MKTKISATIIALFFLTACGSSDQNKTEDEKQPEVAVPSQKFKLKASNMMYVVINTDSSLVANQPDPTKAEVFERVDKENGKCALKASNGKFVCANRARKDYMLANSDNNWEWETFEIIALDQTKINIKTSNGKFVSSDASLDHTLIANRDLAQSWETFDMEAQ
jgi:hypothetical protein